MLRPKSAPKLIPAWAWRLTAWWSSDKQGSRPIGAPSKVPAWFWAWRKWRLSNPKPAPAPAPADVTMYDSIDVTQIPSTAVAVAGYVNGRWPTFNSLASKFPRALRVSIAVTAQADADVLDVEKGDAEVWQVPAWVKRQKARGNKKPGVYTSVSQAAALLAELERNGLSRTDIRLWTAHYTFKPHRCDSSCGFGFKSVADATQYSDKALGKNLDASLAGPTFFNL